MIIQLIRIELLKVKRSLALLMMLACPLMVALLCFGLQLKTNKTGLIRWDMYWAGSTAIWGYFMFPLYLALITGLLNGNEHRNSTWRLMLTLPIQSRQLFLAKFVLAAVFMFGANFALLLMTSCAIYVFGLLGFSISRAFEFDFVHFMLFANLSALPILIFQHWISWRVQNIVAPLAVGVIGTMGIVQIGQSENWIYYPWSYVMTALNASSADVRHQAIILASTLAACALGILTFWIGRRGVEFE